VSSAVDLSTESAEFLPNPVAVRLYTKGVEFLVHVISSARHQQ
jgi:hypothetical protein